MTKFKPRWPYAILDDLVWSKMIETGPRWPNLNWDD
jgi:hypothetical protein